MMLWLAMIAAAGDGPTEPAAPPPQPAVQATRVAPPAVAPAPANLDDLDHWTGRADRLLDGPPGCWEVVGRATWSYDMGMFARNRSDSLFVGRLEDGVWTGFTVVPLGEVERIGRKPETRTYPEEQRFLPLLGRLGPWEVSVGTEDSVQTGETEGTSDPRNVLREALDELGGETEVAWTEWVPSVGVLLHRASPVGAGRNPPEATTTVRFPAGGDTPDAMDVNFPETFHAKGTPRVGIRGARVRVRAKVVDGHAFPTREAFKFRASVLGFSGSAAQTLVYQHVNACAAE